MKKRRCKICGAMLDYKPDDDVDVALCIDCYNFVCEEFSWDECISRLKKLAARVRANL